MDNDLGRRLKRLREESRMSQEQVADALGVSTKTVSNWERGRNDPRSSMGAIEKLFGQSLSADRDPVEAAIRASELVDYRQNRVLAVYQENLHEQRAEEAG